MAKKPTYEQLEQRIKELDKKTVEYPQSIEALKQSLEDYRTLVNELNDGVFTTDNEGTVLFANKALLEIHGYENPDEFVGRNFLEFVSHELRDETKDRFSRMVQKGENRGNIVHTSSIRKDGSTISVQLNASPVKEKGRIVGTRGIIREVTDLKRTEEALRESEKKARQYVDIAGVAFVALDNEGNITLINKRGLEILGYLWEELLGKNWFKTCLPERMTYEVLDVYHQLIRGEVEPVEYYENPVLTKDGKERIIAWHNSVLRNPDGEIVGILSSGEDITDRLLVQEALRESEERFRTVADFTHDWECWIAPDGHYIYISPSCERITGYSPDEFVNDPGLLEKIVHPDDHSTVVNHFNEEQSLDKLPSLDFRIITRSGEVIWISHVCQAVHGADGTYLGRRGSNRDITKQKIMHEELLKAKKLESLGVLAGGIAHDFNNLMSAVVGNISLARIEMKPGSKGFKNLVEAEKASIQTKELTARLITFSEGGGPVKETVSIGDLVKDSVGSSLKGSNIDAGFSIPDDISPVEVDEEQMKQAIRNIITNAQEAMAEQGTINVSCENADIEEKDTLTLEHGKYIKISIEDQGPGIPEGDLSKIFDPYFSTKDMGTQKGMGLGLAISDSIVKQHDGLITVKSELGTGTTFVIYLPASEKEIVEAAPVKEPVPEKYVSQGENILVMDDEKLVRDVSNALLTHVGYKVEVAVEGVEAIEMYRKAMESGKPYDLVILDLTNNFGMGGVETIKGLLKIDPDVKAIVATGYSNDPIISNFREYGFCGSLSKPFSMDDLNTALREVIAGE